ncbi:N-6 DNA methylase [Streptomyces sp. NPDC056308]|uniref:type I restriction-modification system subunit M n=1 Tax=Streptomyces sp. NPDC056308 TaxID=3345780 RepID=UPI0035DC2AB4
MSTKHQELVGFIWSVADLLRGDYRQSEYGKVILPFTVLRRLDCVLKETKGKVLEAKAELKAKGIQNPRNLAKAAGHTFFNRSELNYEIAVRDPDQVAKFLKEYVRDFSSNAFDILEKYDFLQQIDRLDKAGLLYQVAGKFADIDLHPNVVDNHQMGYIFEDLIRRFSEVSNETAGEHFTPREVVRLMVNLLMVPDEEALAQPGVVKRILDPACGTGGILAEAQDHILRSNRDATITVFGQELNAESYAICRSDMMIKGQSAENIELGNSFNDDQHQGRKFDYLLANPPFGVEWKKVKNDVEDEAERGYAGRFGAGLPRINDGSLLFLQHMLDKMKPVEDGGSRIAIVFNGSPLFTGAAESGESNIRRWILENDWLEAVVALPDQLFYNTGISTYFWILTNRKESANKGKVILFDARDCWAKMSKSLGDKRKRITDDQITELTEAYRAALTVANQPEHPMRDKVKVFDNSHFGYRRITVEQPLKLRFEISEENLAQLRASAKIAKAVGDVEVFADAFKPLVGRSWSTKAEAWDAIRQALVEAGLLWPKGTAFAKELRDIVGVRGPEGEVQTLRGGAPEPDPVLRDNENVPLREAIDTYMEREVLPHIPDAWVDHDKTKIGYEIPFTRQFYVHQQPRSLEEIDADLLTLEDKIQKMLGEVTR